MLTRRTPMARGAGFKRPAYTPRPAREQDNTPSTAPARPRVTCNASMTPVMTSAFRSIEKEDPARSEAYRRLVAALPCAHCGLHGNSQAAHADQGKGAHIKSDDRTCYPACGPRPGAIGCHALIGMTGSIPREDRRSLEQKYAAETRAQIEASGQWPKNLQKWTK